MAATGKLASILCGLLLVGGALVLAAGTATPEGSSATDAPAKAQDSNLGDLLAWVTQEEASGDEPAPKADAPSNGSEPAEDGAPGEDGQGGNGGRGGNGCSGTTVNAHANACKDGDDGRDGDDG